MKIYVKTGVSAVALLAAISLAQAQTSERRGEAPSTEREQVKPTQGKQEKGAEREQVKPSQGKQERGAERTQPKPEGVQQKQTEEKGQGASRSQTRTAEEPRDQTKRAEQPGQNEQKGTERRAEGERGDRGREANVRGGQERSRVNIHVTPQAKTRLHEVIQQDSGIRRYRRSDVNVSLNVGTRIPDTITFYDPPPQFVQIDPEFRGYKIVVLDDVILIVDPETREIIDVIEV
jgi:hypothetical protein